ncbi:hydrolase [Streptacidiphilus sp. PB12-B1b]|uniref:hydrolase n=1 Tax=Streptacidiphilus sp. PB12-B1b TaxID=2705012 RepID=UPI0015FDB5EB|nr:hydrolase [Streptacidiphilus sp. PB12-B1b]QMU79372.1 hydrolase [Streptacidiphilus sp. PB12-B1b]
MSTGTPSGGLGAPVGPAQLLSGARLPDGRTVDVRISGGRIEAIGAAGSLSAAERLDLSGYLLLPAPVEPHAHLDEAFSAGPWPEAASGPRTGPTPGPAPEPSPEALQRRITEAALGGLGYGAVAQRTHVRIGDAHALVRLEAALQAARGLRGLMELQVAVLPPPLSGAAGREGRALLREALAMGAHALGGSPDREADPVGCLRALATLAGEAERPLDLHTDAADPLRLAQLTDALRPLRTPVTLGPVPGLGRPAPDGLARAADRLASAGIALVCLPQSGRCVGLAAGADGPRRAGTGVPVRRLRAAGVVVAAGSGAVRDTANPVGRMDPLEAAFLLAACGELDVAAGYESVSAAARTVLGLPPVRLAVGFPAELLAVRGENLRGVLSGGHSRVVLHAGRVVSRTSAVREYADPIAPAVPRQGRSG